MRLMYSYRLALRVIKNENSNDSKCKTFQYNFVSTVGNITAGIIARLMGIPINLFCATNVNDNVEMFFNSGVYEMGGPVVHTPSNAMDIRYPYNVERIVYLFTNAETTVDIVTTTDRCHILPETKFKISNCVNGSCKVETSRIYDTMKRCWEQNDFMVNSDGPFFVQKQTEIPLPF